ncbi:hypothetical protein Tco_1123147 [Tanacetum coccineum]|uniref:Uncharacterized protein n=1 Tax=Tanacetum coccineum TaxID=301880 RepID=A0ABQ5J2I8_9ASTR
METESGNALPRHEAMHSGTPMVIHTKTQRSANNVPSVQPTKRPRTSIRAKSSRLITERPDRKPTNGTPLKRTVLNLNILEERREKAVICEAKSTAKMEKYYNAKVRSTAFRPERLRTTAAMKQATPMGSGGGGKRKAESKMEGPYK